LTSASRRQVSAQGLRGGGAPGLRIGEDGEDLRRGLAKLVLQILNLLVGLVEKQAVRRMESFPRRKQEELGLHLMLLREKMDEMRQYFGLEEDELELGFLDQVDDFVSNTLRSMIDEKVTPGVRP